MILAEKVDIESAPGLAFISQRKLLQLVSLLGDKPLVDVLQQRKIDCNLTDKDQDKIPILKDKITSLIESLQKKKQEGRKKDPSTLLENAVNSLKQRFDDIENDSNCSNQLTTSTLEGIKEKLNRMLDKLEEMIQASG